MKIVITFYSLAIPAAIVAKGLVIDSLLRRANGVLVAENGAIYSSVKASEASTN